MAVYDLTGHALLKGAAASLTAEQLAAETELAELRLGITAKATDDDTIAKLELMLALQVTYQAAAPDALVLASESRGPISKTYRHPGNGLHPDVERMATEMGLVDRWKVTRSTRRDPEVV